MSEEKIKKIAAWLCETGFNNTMSGNYHVSFEEVAEIFSIPVSEVIENKEEIAAYIYEDPRILSEVWVDSDFDMMFVIEGVEDE